MKKVSVKINGKLISTDVGKTILDTALENKIEIPFLCYHPDIEIKHHCGMCLVKISGFDKLKRACSTQVENGMEIFTESPEIKKERDKNLRLILKEHLLECDDCVWFEHCKLLELVRKFEITPKGKKNDAYQVLQTGTIVFDQTKCIGCENCLSVCPVDFLDLNKLEKVEPSSDEKKECISCGQCILHCPFGAIEGVGEFEELEQLFKDKNKITVVQFAPSIRTSVGEEFGMEMGKIATGQLVSGLKKLGFDYVFDTASGADFTTMEEANELIERLRTNQNLPVLSSCCPAWVKFVEFDYPEFIPNLCTSRSPQIMLGGIIKEYWSKEKNIDPKNIVVVSIMPCVAKKFEIKREELKIEGRYPVDCVLTTRELVRLFKKNKIDFKKIIPQEADDPLGSPSGAGVIYGSSGGVFESAFRTAYFKVTGEEMPKNTVKEIRGMEGIKKKEIKIGDEILRICVVSGIKNAQKVMEELKNNPGIYNAVEVMACPGGCVGGGGQSLPTNKRIVQKRSESLYFIDQQRELKGAHNSLAVKKIYADLFFNDESVKKILHTHFAPRKKSEIKKLKDSKETHE
ncbi:MAG TPA: [FeFe] hydrogenase, group A [Candidatus Bathyarchaeia archaeon]|nr:[FeFe] hydrogenase, group A [Candidatus Bathyarchaeia archaeon]